MMNNLNLEGNNGINNINKLINDIPNSNFELQSQIGNFNNTNNNSINNNNSSNNNNSKSNSNNNSINVFNHNDNLTNGLEIF